MLEDLVDHGSQERSNRRRFAGAAILVVDDDRLMRASLESTLLRWGYSVDVATHGVDAIGYLSQRAYDVVITDLQMPLMDGASLWRRAMVAGHPGSWILMTGSAGSGIECSIPILFKPFRLLELRGAVERAIAEERARGMPRVSLDGANQSRVGSTRE